MKVKSASYIYGILILGSGYGFLSTLYYYFTYPPTIHAAPISNKIFSEDLSATNFDATKIFLRNIFNIEGTIPDDGQMIGSRAQCVTSNPSPLPYNVIGILYGGSAESSIVMLENRNTKEIIILKNGANLQGKGSISKIDSNRVWITITGCPEYLELPKFKLPPSRVRKGNLDKTASDASYSEPGLERIGTNTNVTREWVNDILTNKLASVLSEALATPNLVNGRVEGFTISQIEPMSVYDKMGLKNGDVVKSINGIPLNDAGQAIQTLNALRNEGNISLQVMRNGQLTTFQINVQ